MSLEKRLALTSCLAACRYTAAILDELQLSAGASTAISKAFPNGVTCST